MKINPLAKIDGLVGKQDLELWDALDHQRQKRMKSMQSRLIETKSRGGSVSVSHEPSGRLI